MKKNILKSLFNKSNFDWNSPEYIKKCINLIEETDKYNIYQEHESKKNFADQFRKLLDK
jgi:hypothetical protein